MANQDLTFNILAADRGASRTLKNVADAADHVGGRLGALSQVMLKVGSASALGQVAGGVLAGLPAVAGAGAAAMGTLAVAVKGVGAAFSSTADPEAYAEAMNKLSRSAQNFVISGRRVAAGFTEIRQASNAEFFKPLTGVFDQLANRYYPTLARQLPALSNDLGTVSRSFADTISSASAMSAVGQSLQSSRTVIANVGDMVNGLTSGFLRLTGAGGKFAEHLTADLADLGRAFDRFTARAVADGSLARMLDTASNSVRSLGQALAPVGAALYNAFSSKGAAAAAESFFTVLSAGSSVLATLINAFAGLPPGVQSAIVLLGAAGLAASKMNNLMQVASSGMSLTAIALESLGSAGAKASAGVGAAATMVGRAAGPIGIAVGVVTALALAFSSSGEKVKQVEIDVGRLNDSFKVFSATGKISGELAKQTGGSFQVLASKIRAAEQEVARAQAREAVGGGRSLGQALAYKQEIEADRTKAAGELANIQKSMGAVAKQIADMARGGDIVGAAAAATQFREAMLGEGKSLEWVNQQLGDYIGITGGATVAQYNVAQGAQAVELQQRTLNGTWEDAINRLGGLTQAFDILNGRFLSAREAELAAEEAAHRFGEAIKEAGGKLDERSEKGRAAELALIGIAKATEAATSAAYKQALATKSEADALAASKKVFDEHKQQVIDAGIAAGMTREQAKALADQYIKMPTNISTAVSAPGATRAKTEVELLREEIQDLRGKQVQISESGAPDAEVRIRRLQERIDALTSKTVYINMVENRTRSGTRGDDSVYERGWGGIDLKMGAGGTTQNYMSRWLHSPTILAGERGSEAYISSAAPPARSRQIIREAADMVGGPQTIWPGGGGAGMASALDRLAAAVLAMGGQRAPTEVVISAGPSALEQLLLEVLRAAIRVRGGNVQSVLGQGA